MDETWLSACPVCESRQIPELRGYDHAFLRRCANCRLVFAARRPRLGELRDYYEHYGRAAPRSPITRSRYDELLESFEPYRSVNRILDVGCGEGWFLEAAAAKGWEVHGTESTDGAVERNRARGIEMTLAPARSGDLPRAAFDVVTALEVVEHLTDPRAEAAAMASAIRAGGLLYVTTPNFDSATRRVLGPAWDVVGWPEHLLYFTGSTLEQWLHEAGFARLSLTTTGVSPRHLVRSARRRSTGLQAAPATCDAIDDERVRAAVERSPVLRAGKRLANTALGAARAGDTLKGRFERRPEGPVTAA